MTDSPNTPDLPEPPEEPNPTAGGRIGVDSWVAESEQRRARGPGALLARGWEGSPDALKLLAFVAIAVSVPFWPFWSFSGNGYGDLFIFGLFTLLYVALGLGLNVVVGLSGLLDLGYVAFYGIGAYTYAELSSPQYGIHWPAEATIPLAMLAAALVGVVLGFVSRRLLGDYLAIVTLFLGQAFVFFTLVANPNIAGKGLTGGANGLPQVDPLTFFGYKLTSIKQLYFFLLIVVVFLAVAIYFANQSRTGRAWRALREDPLAAEVMSIPVNRLKILAFVFGAAVAGLCGAIYAAIETAAVATNFSVSVLIIIYAIVILGGLGSIAGTFIGATIINCTFEFLEPQNDHPEIKRWLFYGTIVLLILLIKPLLKPALVLAGTIGFGFAVHAIVVAETAKSWTNGAPVSGGKWISSWAIIPTTSHGNFNNYVYIGLIVAIVCTASLRGWWRMAALVPTLYLVALAWENVLAQNGGITAFILFGAMLIGLMATRPQGLLGTARVEIV
jgi:branched-chain amino acid transport system permease protein